MELAKKFEDLFMVDGRVADPEVLTKDPRAAALFLQIANLKSVWDGYLPYLSDRGREALSEVRQEMCAAFYCILEETEPPEIHPLKWSFVTTLLGILATAVDKEAAQ